MAISFLCSDLRTCRQRTHTVQINTMLQSPAFSRTPEGGPRLPSKLPVWCRVLACNGCPTQMIRTRTTWGLLARHADQIIEMCQLLMKPHSTHLCVHDSGTAHHLSTKMCKRLQTFHHHHHACTVQSTRVHSCPVALNQPNFYMQGECGSPGVMKNQMKLKPPQL